MPNSEIEIAEKYSVVISALVPFAARGKLSEGLNKLRARIDKRDLEEIRYEVNRLISPCDKSVDTQSFAKGKCYKIKVDDVELTLDAVGERIFEAEMNKHNRTYSQGVYEAVSSEERYNLQLKQEQHQRIVEAFSVDCLQGNNDIDVEVMKVIPDFTVTCIKINNNEPIPFAYLSKNELAISIKGKPSISVGEAVTFTFPAMPKVTDAPYTAGYKCRSIKGAEKRGISTLIFVAEADEKWLERLETFIRQNASDLPLEASQELTRTRERILKDAIISNAPISATLCEQMKGELLPRSMLLPQATTELDPENQIKQSLSYAKNVFSRLSKEFQKSRETYQFRCTVLQNEKIVHLVANLGELLRDGLLSAFISQGKLTGSLRVFRLSLVSKQDALLRAKQYDSEPLETMRKLKFIVYCADVSNELNHFELSQQQTPAKFPNHYHEGADYHQVDISLPNHLNRRSEARYEFPCDATVKYGLLNSDPCTLIDISSRGMQLKLNQVWSSNKNSVKVSVPALELANVKYDLVRLGESGDVLHLQMTEKSAEKYAYKFNRILAHNISYFTPRSKQLQQEKAFDYLWDLVTCSLPGVHILVGKGKDPSEQLIVAHTDGAAKSLAPFSIKQSKLPTHGWFVNSDQDPPESSKINTILERSTDPERALFYVNRRKGRYTTLSKDQFSDEETRQKLHNSIKNKHGKLIAHCMQVAVCNSLDENWYHKRCKHLAEVDKPAIGQIRQQENACQNLLSIIPVSMLHQHLLLIGDFHG